jgi:murein DD-endopeptidase MepM/ murein hydrolase activator NlpD
VQRGQTLWRICRTYGVALERVVAANDIRDAAEIEVGQRIFIPGARTTMEVPAAPPSPAPSSGDWSWPAEGPVTSRFGVPRGSHLHKGIDIDTEKGQAIRAARSGRVVFSGRRGDYGLLVILEHDEGFSSWYAHNSRVLVESGQRVREGEVIAKSGRTGRASGTHLHFEIRHRGKPLDPLTFLP